MNQHRNLSSQRNPIRPDRSHTFSTSPFQPYQNKRKYQRNSSQRDLNLSDISRYGTKHDLNSWRDFLDIYLEHLSDTCTNLESRSFSFVVDHLRDVMSLVLSLIESHNSGGDLEFLSGLANHLFNPLSEGSLFKIVLLVER